MVARQKHARHAPTLVLGRPRVLRPLQQTLCMRLALERRGLDHARHDPRDRVDDDHRRELAAGEDEIADPALLVDVLLDCALVYTLVVTSDQPQMRLRPDTACSGL